MVPESRLSQKEEMLLPLSVLLLNLLGGLYSIPIEAEWNPLENPDLFEGDIEIEGDTDRSAVIYKSFLWPGGVIPFVLDKDLLIDPQIIYKAMKEIMSSTCLKFIPRTYQKDYIKFILGNRCSTKVGHRGGEHAITLGNGCNTIGIVMHEIGHAIGFFHEHNRSDRHKFIRILWENIKTGKDSQFQQRKEGTEILLTPFDFDSFMLYGSNFFSKDPKKLNTMVSLDHRKKLPDIRKRTNLSPVDIHRIKLLYHCECVPPLCSFEQHV